MLCRMKCCTIQLQHQTFCALPYMYGGMSCEVSALPSMPCPIGMTNPAIQHDERLLCACIMLQGHMELQRPYAAAKSCSSSGKPCPHLHTGVVPLLHC